MGKITGFKEFERKDETYKAVKERVQDYNEFTIPLKKDELTEQGSRCMDCGIPFCHSACPLGNLIPDFNDMVHRGEWKKASYILHTTNNFPEFTGRLCPAPCEQSCVLGIIDDPISIENIEKNGKVKEYFDVLADVTGYVSKRNVSVGEYVKTGDVLFEIVNLNRVWVVFDAYEKDLSFLKVGNNISFTVSSLSGKTFESKINYIDPVIDSQKRTAAVRTEISNSGGILKPEMFVSGKLTSSLSHKKDARFWVG